MADRPSRTIEFQAGIKWRIGKFGEVFVGEDKKSRGLVNPPPVFGGVDGTYNAEDMLISSLALCQMSTFLHFVSANEIDLISYENQVVGTLTKGKDGFSYTHYKINVDIVVASGDRDKAVKAVELAKRFCLISNSLKGEEEHNVNITEQEMISENGK